MTNPQEKPTAAEPRLNDRLGKFYISCELVREHPDKVALILNGVTVIRAEAMFAYDAIEYHGMHPHFEPSPMNREIPEYKAFIHEAEVDGDIERVVVWESIGPDGMTVSELSGEQSAKGSVAYSSVGLVKEKN
jgi:hypothetical protein